MLQLLPVGGSATATAAAFTSPIATLAAPPAAALIPECLNFQGPTGIFQGRAAADAGWTPAPLGGILNVYQLSWVQHPNVCWSAAIAPAAGPPLEDQCLSAPDDEAGGVLALELDGRRGTRQQLGLALWALDGQGKGSQVTQAQGKPLQGVVCNLLTARKVQVFQRATRTQRCPTEDTRSREQKQNIS